jgi:hypothetical protein
MSQCANMQSSGMVFKRKEMKKAKGDTAIIEIIAIKNKSSSKNSLLQIQRCNPFINSLLAAYPFPITFAQ